VAAEPVKNKKPAVNKASISQKPPAKKLVAQKAFKKLYRVKAGDTLWSLARMQWVSVEDIKKVNHPKALLKGIHPNQLIYLPVKPQKVEKQVKFYRRGALTQDRVVVRNGPGTNYPRNTVIDRTAPFLITNKTDQWLQVKLTSGYTGWIRRDLVVIGPRVHVTSPGQNLASARSSSRRNLWSGRGELSANVDWNERDAAAASKGQLSIVKTAMQYRGVRYRYGGTSPSSGFDCSGFVRYVYGKKGVSLPHSSRAISEMGTSVPKSQAKPGDVVYMPGHVGIYAGNGKYIHAPHPGAKVRVAQLNWRKVTTVRRIKR
jgi:cell wall-associated NlpC family hydrolase